MKRTFPASGDVSKSPDDPVPGTSSTLGNLDVAKVAARIEYDKDLVAGYPGQNFEWKLCGLLYLLSFLRKSRIFQLAVNVKGAGCLDDVVLKVQRGSDWMTSFIQLKHKNIKSVKERSIIKTLEHSTEKRISKYENKSLLTELMLIGPKSLTNLNSVNSGFYVPRYFKSYCEIKKQMKVEDPRAGVFDGDIKNSDFIIYTNAVPDKYVSAYVTVTENLKDEVLKKLAENRIVLNFERDVSPRTELVHEFAKDLRERCLAFASRYEYSVTESDVEDFLERFFIVCGAPNEDEFDALIKIELNKVLRQEKNRVGLNDAFTIYMGEVKKWWLVDTFILDQNSDLVQKSVELGSVQTYVSVQKLKLSFDINFTQLSLDSLNNKLNNQLCVIDCGDTPVELPFTKLLQLLESQTNVFTILSTKSSLKEQDAVISAWKSKGDCLVIVEENEEENEIWTKVCNILNQNNEKRLIYIHNNLSSLPEQLDNFHPRTKITSQFLLQELEDESQTAILDHPVQFQGDETTFREIFNDDWQTHKMTNSFLAPCLEDILEAISSNKPIVIGEKLSEGLSYFIPRTYSRSDILKQDILQDTSCDQIVLTGISQEELDKKYPQNKCVLCNEDKAEEKYDELCKQGGNVHWIQFEGRLLKWKRSNGNLDLIQDHIDEERVTQHELNTSTASDERFVVLLGKPGIGKSSQVLQLANELKLSKEENINWVIPIRLNDHTKLLHEYLKQNKKIDFHFLASIAGIEEFPKLERHLFGIFVNQFGNVTIFLDGADEISPRYTDLFLQLVTYLKDETKVKKCWILSRSHLKAKIEKFVSTISMTLEKFSEEDNIKFIKRYMHLLLRTKYKKDIPEEIIVTIEENIPRLLDLVQTSMKDRNQLFCENPMQLMMLTEVFEENIRTGNEIPKPLEMVDLVQKFIQKKLFISYLDQENPNTATAGFKQNKKSHYEMLNDNHMIAALYLIISDEEWLENLPHGVYKQKIEFFYRIKEGTERSGIITEIDSDGRPVFIHRIFAECFVAMWLASNYEHHREFIKSNIYQGEFEVILYIFNQILTRDCVLMENETCFLTLRKSCDLKMTLHGAVLNKNIEEVKTLLADDSIDLRCKDHGGRSVLHLAAMLGSDSMLESSKIVKELLEKYDDVYIKDRVFQWNTIEYAIHRKSWPMLEHCLRKGLLKRDDKELDTLLRNTDYNSIRMLCLKFDFDKLISVLIDIWLKDDTCSDSSLHLDSAKHGSINICSLLLERNPDWIAISDTNNQTLLYMACRYSHLNVVVLLIDSIIDPVDKIHYVNFCNKMNRSAIHFAGNVDIVRELILAGADIMTRDKHEQTPLHFACLGGHEYIVELLLNTITDPFDIKRYVDSCDKDNQSALHKACKGGNAVIVKVLIEAGADVTLGDKFGKTPLHLACLGGHQDVVTLLLSDIKENYPVNMTDYVNQYDNDGFNAIALASSKGFVEIVKALEDASLVSDDILKSNTDELKNIPDSIEVVEERTESASSFGDAQEMYREENAKQRHRLDDSHALATRHRIGSRLDDQGQYDAPEECEDQKKKFADVLDSKVGPPERRLFLACNRGLSDPDIVSALIEEGADFNYVSDNDKSLLHYPSQYGHKDTVKLLLENIADVNIQDEEGQTALYVAASQGQMNIVDLLIEAKADAGILDNAGSSALHVASMRGHLPIVKRLVESISKSERGTFIRTRDKRGDTALTVAEDNRRRDVHGWLERALRRLEVGQDED